jgi:hypothetical protein
MMRALDPAPTAVRGAFNFIVLTGERTELGTRVELLVKNGKVAEPPRYAEVFILSSGHERDQQGAAIASATGLLSADTVGALGELIEPTEAALRKMPDEQQWEPLVPLSVPVPAMPFPVRALISPALMNFVTATAAAYKTPPDYAAAGVLGALSCAIGLRRELHLGGELYATACVWIVAVGRSGSGKTPPWRRALRPLRKIQDARIEQYEEEVKAYRGELADWEQAKPGERGQKPESPILARLLLKDITLEAMAAALRHCPAGVLLARDELSGWLTNFDRYRAGGAGSDRSAWLELWDHETIDVERKTGDDRIIYVKRPYIAVSGTIQPKRYTSVVGNQDDGFSARVLPCYPDAPVAPLPEAYIDPEVEAAYEALLGALLELPSKEDAKALALSRDARRRYGAHDAAFKRDWPADASPRLDEALSKLCIYAGRLTLVLLLACQAAQFEVTDTACVDAAWELIGYFRQNVLRIHGDGGERYEHARRIVSWIWRHEREQFSTAELYDDLRRTFDHSDDMDTALAELEDRHYVRLLPEPPHAGRGRKPSARYAVNPEVCTKNTNNPRNSDPEPNRSGYSDLSDVFAQEETQPDDDGDGVWTA